MTSSCHRFLGLPTGLVPIGFQSNSFLVAPLCSFSKCSVHDSPCIYVRLPFYPPVGKYGLHY
jgi:hypothetical protein